MEKEVRRIRDSLGGTLSSTYPATRVDITRLLFLEKKAETRGGARQRNLTRWKFQFRGILEGWNGRADEHSWCVNVSGHAWIGLDERFLETGKYLAFFEI